VVSQDLLPGPATKAAAKLTRQTSAQGASSK
jgi:hypothetical protein